VWPINYTQVYVLASPVDKLCWSGVTRTRQKHHTTTNGVREPRLHQAALGLLICGTCWTSTRAISKGCCGWITILLFYLNVQTGWSESSANAREALAQMRHAELLRTLRPGGDG
jgi:hypothetical protein